MPRVLALCSPADPTGAVKQFDLALPLLRERFDIVRHTVDRHLPPELLAPAPDLIHTLGAAAFRAVRAVALRRWRPGKSFPKWLAAGAAETEPPLGCVPGLTATFSQSEHERDWAARLVPAPLQFSGKVGVFARRASEGDSPALGESGPPYILAAGGFDAVANLKQVVWAFDALKYAHPDLHLVLLGDGPQRADVERFARHLGADDELRVHFAGFRPDVTPHLARAEQVWCTHTRGGVKFVLEAMASGVPVIAARTADTGRVIADGMSGVLVPADRPVEMARAAHALLGSPDRRRALVVAGEGAAARHPVADLADALAGLYHTLTSFPPARHE